MQKIILPRLDSETGSNHNPIPEGFEKIGISNTMSQETKEVYEIFGKLSEKLIKIEKDIKNYEEKIQQSETKIQSELRDQYSKNIETIGIFSAVMALLIININIIESAPNFLAAILLLVGSTGSMLIFASLIHILLSPNKTKNCTPLWIGAGILTILVILGVVFYIKGKDLFYLVINSSTVINTTGITD